MLRHRYKPVPSSAEKISDIKVTVPDLALTIEDIFQLAMDGQDPSLEYVPDNSYFEDLSDYLPNVDELHVVTLENQNVSENLEQEQKIAPQEQQNDVSSPSISVDHNEQK